MVFRNSAIWLYRQMTARSRRRLLDQLREKQQMPIAVLFYHLVSDVYVTPWTINSSDFKRHLDWLQQNFDIVSLEEAQRRIRSTANDKFTVAITFDDGYSENCQTALPELVNRGIPITYFVTTDYMSSSQSFRHDIELGVNPATNTWEQLREFADKGIEIGAHTRTHCNVGLITDRSELESEVMGSIKRLEVELCRPCRYFAFPYGRPDAMSQESVTMLYQNGMRGFCSAYGALNWPGQHGFHIRRIHGDPGLERLKNWLTLDFRHLKDSHQLQFSENFDFSSSVD